EILTLHPPVSKEGGAWPIILRVTQGGLPSDLGYRYSANPGSSFVVSGTACGYMSCSDQNPEPGGATEALFNVGVGANVPELGDVLARGCQRISAYAQCANGGHSCRLSCGGRG